MIEFEYRPRNKLVNATSVGLAVARLINLDGCLFYENNKICLVAPFAETYHAASIINQGKDYKVKIDVNGLETNEISKDLDMIISQENLVSEGHAYEYILRPYLSPEA